MSVFDLECNGHRIGYEDSQKHTLPVIFIHGFPFNRTMWQPQYDFLKETHRVIIYDLPGFGKSTPLKEAASISAFADDLIQFMRTLKIEKAVVAGLSMGGYILLNAVERYPECFSAIVLSDTQCLADSKENAQKRYDTILKIEKEGLENFAMEFLENVFSEDTKKEKKELTALMKQVIQENSIEAICDALKAMAERKETCSGLKRIPIPALILCGEEDSLTPVARSEFLFSNMSNAELHTIKKAGHLPNLEQPDEFNDRLHNFISDIIL